MIVSRRASLFVLFVLAAGTAVYANDPPTLTVQPRDYLDCNSTPDDPRCAQELKGMGLWVVASDPNTSDTLRLTVDYSAITGGDDEPEFFAEPAQITATETVVRGNFYWEPALGRGNQDFIVRFSASDGVNPPVVQAVTVHVDPCRYPDVTLTMPTERNYQVTDGVGWLTISGITLSDTSPMAVLKIDFSPALEPNATDLPLYSYSENALYWQPNCTRGGQTYTLTLTPGYKGRFYTAHADTLSITVNDPNFANIAFPRDTIYSDYGDDFDFQMLTDKDPNVTYTLQSGPPGATLSSSGAFHWEPNDADISRYVKLSYKPLCGTYETNESVVLCVKPTADEYAQDGSIIHLAGNLVVNPNGSVPDPADPNRPLGWTWFQPPSPDPLCRRGEPNDPPLSTIRDPNFESTAGEFGWKQLVCLTPRLDEVGEENAIYELTLEYKIEDVTPNLQLNPANSSQRIARPAAEAGLGINATVYGPNQWGYYVPATTGSAGRTSVRTYEMDAGVGDRCPGTETLLDPEASPYSWSDYRIQKVKFKLPRRSRAVLLSTHHMSQGRLLVKYVSLRRVDEDAYPFRTSGQVSLLHHPQDPNQAVFPFVVDTWNRRVHDEYGQHYAYDRFAHLGFNSVAWDAWDAADGDKDPNVFLQNGLLATDFLDYAPAYMTSELHPANLAGVRFASDPVTYIGASWTLNRINGFPPSLPFIIVHGTDEQNSGWGLSGFPITGADGYLRIRELTATTSAYRNALSANGQTNITANLLPYSGFNDEVDEAHARDFDVIYYTWNDPGAYSMGRSYYNTTRGYVFDQLANTGRQVRRWQEVTSRFTLTGAPKPVMNSACGHAEWNAWNSPYSTVYHASEFVPYHLQRFNVYNPIVNGVAGIRTYIPAHLETELFSRRSFSALGELATELKILNRILIEPTFVDDWSVETPGVYLEGMLKYDPDDPNKAYLIVTNPSQYAQGTVAIRYTGIKTLSRVVALFEQPRTNDVHPVTDDSYIDPNDVATIHRRGWTRHDWSRPVAECVWGNSDTFTDEFIDYAAHVYKLTFSDQNCNGNETPDSCEIAANPALDCDGNGVLDACELTADPSLDCNSNGVIDSCDITANPSLDCDGNGRLDTCDIFANAAFDVSNNGLVDSCESAATLTLDAPTPNPIAVGDSLSLSATVLINGRPVPGVYVVFTRGQTYFHFTSGVPADPNSTVVTTNTSGVASVNIAADSVGACTFTATVPSTTIGDSESFTIAPVGCCYYLDDGVPASEPNTFESWCQTQPGGVWIEGAACAAPNGCCALSNGTTRSTIQAVCTALGGTFNAGTVCETVGTCCYGSSYSYVWTKETGMTYGACVLHMYYEWGANCDAADFGSYCLPGGGCEVGYRGWAEIIGAYNFEIGVNCDNKQLLCEAP